MMLMMEFLSYKRCVRLRRLGGPDYPPGDFGRLAMLEEDVVPACKLEPDEVRGGELDGGVLETQ